MNPPKHLLARDSFHSDGDADVPPPQSEPLPDIATLVQTSPWTDAAAAMLFAAGGLFIGGELGVLTGSWRARRSVTADPERRARIENAFRRYRADVLRREAQRLEAEAGGEGLGILESAKSVVGWR